MSSSTLPSQPLLITKEQARRFMLTHHKLMPPHQLNGKRGIVSFIRKVGCIQFDPINIVGRNPDLVLQARVENYRVEMLDQLLYQAHTLMDCFDKVSSICLARDWPYFERHRQRMQENYWHENTIESRLARELLEVIRDKGTIDPAQFKNGSTILWTWGRPARVERAALEVLYAVGKVHIASRVGSRRSFDVIERLIPAEILSSPDPNPSLEAYHDWHVLRRLGGLGLGRLNASEAWLGIQYMKTPERRETLTRLIDTGKVLQVEIESLPGRTFFMRAIDLSTIQRTAHQPIEEPKAVFLPPLDNLLWDRQLLQMVFDFQYKWEAYTVPHKRKYGHYTLPVLFGDRFIARFDPVMDRKKGELLIKNWWWEDGIKVGRVMQSALMEAMQAFMAYLQTKNLKIPTDVKSRKGMEWLRRI